MSQMKKIIFIVLFINCVTVFSQNPTSGFVEYTVESINPVDSLKFSKDKTIGLNERKELIELLAQPAYFKLKFNLVASIYHNKSFDDKMSSDSDKHPKLNFLESIGGGNGIYYTNPIERKTYVQKNMFGDLLLISYDTPSWKLLNETKKIGDYNCYKAVKNVESNSKDVVWYTPEISVPFGPTLYNGLPGLVLEVNIGKIRIIATKITIDKESKINIEKPKKGIKISQKDYKKKLSEFADEIGF